MKKELKIKKGVAVVPIYKDRFVLLKQIRDPYKKPFLNLVMGGIKENETPIAAAKRECMEEVSIKNPLKLKRIAKVNQMPGSVNIETTIFICECGLTPQIPSDITEPIIDIEFYSKKQIENLIREEKITESTTLLSLLLVLSDKIKI